MTGITDITLVQTGVDERFGPIYTIQVEDDLVEDVTISVGGYQEMLAFYNEGVLRDVLNTQLNVSKQYGVDMDHLLALLADTFTPKETPSE